MDDELFAQAIRENDLATVSSTIRRAGGWFASRHVRHDGDSISPIESALRSKHPEMVMLLADHVNVADYGTLRLIRRHMPELSLPLIQKIKHTPRDLEILRASPFDDGMRLESYYKQLDEHHENPRLNSPPGKKPVADSYDKMISEITADPSLSKLAKRIPPETIKGKLNPEYVYFIEVLREAAQLSNSICRYNDTNLYDNGKMHVRKDMYFLVPKLLDNTYENNWEHTFDKVRQFNHEDREFTQTVRYFTQVAVLPAFAKKAKNLLTSGKVNLQKVADQLVPEVAKVLIENRSIPTLYELQRDWHTDYAALDNTIRDPNFQMKHGTWPPLSKDFTASNGLVLSFATHPDQLEMIGNELRNCLGGGAHTRLCMLEDSHIAMIHKDGKLLTFVQLREERDSQGLPRMEQHNYIDHGKVDDTDPASVALREYREAVRSGSVEIDSQALRISRDKRIDEATDMRYVFGFDPFNEKTAATWENKALHEHLNVRNGGRTAERHTVPSLIANSANCYVPGGHKRWAHKTTTDFLNETGLTAIIDNVVSSYTGTSPAIPAATGRTLTA